MGKTARFSGVLKYIIMCFEKKSRLFFVKWHNFLENYLNSRSRGAIPDFSVIPELVALPLLRAHIKEHCDLPGQQRS